MSIRLPVRFTGPFTSLSRDDRTALFQRAASPGSGVGRTVEKIISRVRLDGDNALRQMAIELDGVELRDIEVPKTQIEQCFNEITPELRAAMQRSARNIAMFHESQTPTGSLIVIEPGLRILRRPDPLDKVGVYAPGGRAAYPSSVLMGAIPARIAGVSDVILCSPPGANGLPNHSVLAAAYLAGVDRVFSIGGAGAIAAMCIGTDTVPRVDKVVGPGNAYVAEAKLQLAHAASFDSPAGPSELLVIADDSADPGVIVREMLAQAEHDPLASVVVVTIGQSLADAIQKIIVAEIAAAVRHDIIEQSLGERGAVISVDSLADAIAISNQFAPEHLLVVTSDSESLVSQLRNAGTVFVGASSSVAFGDYMTGANHVLPTGGLARSYSGLSTLDFVRWTSIQTIDTSAAARLCGDVSVFATAEGLHAHAAAARGWQQEDQ